MELETIFWPSPRVLPLGKEQDPASPGSTEPWTPEVQGWEESSGLLFQGMGEMRVWYGGISPGRELPDPLKGVAGPSRQQRGRPPLLSHSPTSLCVECARGPPAQIRKSARHPLAPPGLPRAGTPKPLYSTSRTWR